MIKIRDRSFDLSEVLLWVATAVSFAGAAAVFAARLRLLTIVHHDVGGVAQNVIYGIQTILATGKLYSDPSHPPYAIMQYAPVYYYVVAGLAKLIGIGPNDIVGLYRLSRGASLFFSLSGCWVLYGLARTFSVSRLAAASTVAMAFVFIRVTDFARPDSLYHLLVFVTVFLLVRFSRSGFAQTSLLYGAVGAGVVAVLTKQSGIVLPFVALCILLATPKGRPHILRASGVYVLLLAFGVLAACIVSGAVPFWENVHGGVDNGISFDWFYRRIIKLYARELSGWIVLILGASVALRLHTPDDEGAKSLAIAIPCLFGFGVLTALKWGSMPSYFTPYVLLGFVAASIVAGAPAYGHVLSPRIARVAFVLALVFGTTFEASVRFKETWLPDEKAKLAEAEEVRGLINDRLHESDWVLSLMDRGTLLDRTFMNNVFFDHAILPQKDIVSCCAFKRKRFDYSEFHQRGDKGLVAYLIKRKGSRLSTYIKTNLTSFEKVETTQNYEVYRHVELE